MKNVISKHLSAEDRQAFDALLLQLETLLNGKLNALTEQERRVYGKINEQNKLLVNKVRDYCQHSPNMKAPEVNWDEFEADYQSRTYLESCIDRLARIVYQLESTYMLHSFDNYHDSLTDYDYSQYKKKAGESGFTEKVADLKQFFPRGNQKDNEPNPPN